MSDVDMYSESNKLLDTETDASTVGDPDIFFLFVEMPSSLESLNKSTPS